MTENNKELSLEQKLKRITKYNLENWTFEELHNLEQSLEDDLFFLKDPSFFYEITRKAKIAYIKTLKKEIKDFLNEKRI